MPHLIYILFVFAFGACVGSFLNVVVWRLPRNESLVTPPSHCPRCNTRLSWRDNIPIFGWLLLRGKCRYCKEPISIRYPLIEFVTGALFVVYYVAIFIFQEGPIAPRPMTLEQDWPLFLLYLVLISALLASSLIDIEHYQIPIELPWAVAGLAFLIHGFINLPYTPGALNSGPAPTAMAAGAGVGLVISILLLRAKILRQSFAEGGPLLEWERKEIDRRILEAKAQGRELEHEPIVQFTPAQIREEMRKEMLFLMPPLLLGGLWLLICWRVPVVGGAWNAISGYGWIGGFLSSLWGALVGAFIIWFFRIAGSIVFGREAMGLGDVHLMFGIGAAIGAAGATLVFFLAPFVGLIFALYKLVTGRGREVPYGPFLSLATAFVLLFYWRIIEYFAPQMENFLFVVRLKLFGV